MNKLISRSSLHFALGILAFLPLAGILSPGSSSSQSVSKINSKNTLMQSASKHSQSTQRYTNFTYHITLNYPKNWQPTKGYEERFNGADGFFQISSIGFSDDVLPGQPRPTLQDTCNVTATHKLRPYGSRPQIQRLQIQGRPACLILPSPDQDSSMEKMATLIARYPKTIRIGTMTYDHLMLNANKGHIREIANTLKFTRLR
ncbi:MAG: hypothetical protein WBG73_11390 [Coleofasciculaceae cyanobacterium]